MLYKNDLQTSISSTRSTLTSLLYLQGAKQRSKHIISSMQVDKEKFYIEENKRIREELGIDHRLYHIDIPLSIETEINLLEQAGFKNVYIHKQWDNTSIFVCHKGI